ncbi:MAG TPA: L,D-transpeptidase family protein [Longimicrobiales bacterium]
MHLLRRMPRRDRSAARAPLLAAAITLLAACDPDDDATPAYDAAVPVPAVDALDSTAIERARFDTTWRRYAEEDRRRRARAAPDGVPDGIPAAPDGAPDDLPRGAPDGLPHHAPGGLPRDGPHDAPRNGPHDAPHDGPQNGPRDGPHDGPQDGPPGASGDPAAPPAPSVDPAAIPGRPAAPVPEGASILRVQVLLDRLDFSPGAIDGRWGQNTAKAVFWFQHEEGLEPTGRVDRRTYARLVARGDDAAAVGRYEVRDEDVDGPFRRIPADIYQKARLDCLCYASPLERLAERFHTTPALLRRLNPGVDFRRLDEDDEILVPNVRPRHAGDRRDIVRIVISRHGAYTHALDEDGRIVFHFPSTLGSRYAPTPVGGARVAAIVPLPRFHYTPSLYHDVPDTWPDAVLPPGPNSPIGSTWIQLSRRFYGIHGTAEPETIGYAASHGCVRLTNWDAHALAEAIEVGTAVEFR